MNEKRVCFEHKVEEKRTKCSTADNSVGLAGLTIHACSKGSSGQKLYISQPSLVKLQQVLAKRRFYSNYLGIVKADF